MAPTNKNVTQVQSCSVNNGMSTSKMVNDIPDVQTDENCKMCKAVVQKGELAIWCDVCESWIHAICLPGGVEQYNSEKKKYIWTCSAECNNGICVPSDIQECDTKKANSTTIMDAIRGLIIQGAKTVNFVMPSINSNVQKLNDEVKVIRKDCSSNRTDIECLKSEINMLKQDRVNHQAIFINVPKEAVSQNILPKILQEYNIQPPKRVCKVFDSKKHSDKCNVLVDFVSPEDKFKFINEIKSKKPKINERTTLYVVECLSPENTQLLVEAKQCLQSYRFKWSKNGRVYVRKESSSSEPTKAIWVKNTKILQELKEAEEQAGSAPLTSNTSRNISI